MPVRTISSGAVAVNRPAVRSPVVVSVPHAGRIYPPDILAAARVGQADLERLEDRWCDRIAADATDAGATVVQALWARAVADCNRGEGQMAPGEVAVALRTQFSAPGRKERAGLGVVPTRMGHCGPLWRRPVDRAEFDWRLDMLHRPYHAALAKELAAAHQRFGHAILVDLHSMPPIPPGQAGYGAGVVIGDHFSATADAKLVDVAIRMARQLPVPVSHNLPYAGGHIVRTHGCPARQRHAVQIEVDRSLYLNEAHHPDPARCAAMARWFATLIEALVLMLPDSGAIPQAAE